MKRSVLPVSVSRSLATLAVLGLAVALDGCNPNPPVDSACRVDKNQDGTSTLTFRKNQGKAVDYSCLKEHPNASKVQMGNSDVTDKELPLLEGLKGLRELDLSNTQVTDEGLAALQKLEKLEVLHLANTGVTNKCLETLADLDSLRRLDLLNTKVTLPAAEKWKSSKPGRSFQL